MVRVANTGDACLVKSCDTVILRTGYLMKESYLEIPTAAAACRAGSEVVSLPGETENRPERL